jgi:hypothetical protein
MCLPVVEEGSALQLQAVREGLATPDRMDGTLRSVRMIVR